MNRIFHFTFSVALTCAMLFWLFSQVLVERYPDKSPYTGVEVRFNNTKDVRTGDYILRADSGHFLLAPNAPKELRARMEFLHTGNFVAVVSAQYPDWLCKQDQFDKSTIAIQGGSLNETVKLIRGKSTEVEFAISKGQQLTYSIRNKDRSECGRATIEFYEKNNYSYFATLFVLTWVLLFTLCWLVAASPYIAMLGAASSILYIAGSGTIQTFGTGGLIFNTVVGLVVSAMLFLFSVIPLKSKILTLCIKLLVSVVLTIPLALLLYMNVFSVPLDAEAIHGAMQSYDSQIFEFWQQFIGKRRTVYFVLMLVALYACLRHINLTKPKTASTVTSALLLLTISLVTVANGPTNSAIINLLTRSVIEYKWEIEAFKKIADRRELSATKATRDPSHANNATVIVIGESVNKKHMSAYGYVRDTTPLMNKRIAAGEVVQFNRVYSNHTHSNPTMSLILTQANQYNQQSWLESPSVFNYARSAGVETHWLTNHRLLGGWSNQITTIINEADRLKTINYKIGYGTSSSHYDHDLVPLYKEALKQHKNQLTMLHLYNSHSSYCDRYPEDASVYKWNAPLPKSHFGNLDELHTFSLGGIACYDNTILYTDGVLDELIKALENNAEPSVLLYVTDHAEEPLTGRTHNSATFTFDMINIPLFVWANNAWQKQHAKLWENLQKNRNKIVTNDLMFESILGLAGIKDASIRSDFDISSENYRSLDKPLTLHRRLEVAHPENWNYWQNENSLAATKNDIALIAANIRSIGEGRAALYHYGLKKLQINVEHAPEHGIQLSDVEALSLSSFIESLGDKKPSTLYVNFVEETQKTPAQAIKQLLELEQKHNIEIIKIDDKPEKVLELSSPKLIAQTKQRRKNSEKTPIWVNIKTRYRNQPPVAW